MWRDGDEDDLFLSPGGGWALAVYPEGLGELSEAVRVDPPGSAGDRTGGGP